MANQCGREPRWQRRLSFLTDGVDYSCGKLLNFRTQCRLGRVSSDASSVAFSHSDGTETNRGKEDGRRCCLETVGSVFASPESAPSGLGKTNIGEDIAPREHFGSMGIASAPRAYPRKGEKSDFRGAITKGRRSCGVAMASYEDTNRSGRKIRTTRYLGRDAMDNSPPELTGRRSKNRSWRTK